MGNEIKEATFEDALYCAKALVGDERCEECRFYTLGDLWCDDTYRIMHEALEEVKAYRAIGTVEEFKALKEKNEPKKLLTKWDMYPTNHGIYSASDRWCPNCKALVFDGDWDNCRQRIMYGKYRCSCGQKLDWSE